MENIQEFKELYDVLLNDKRIRTVHMSLYMGFFLMRILKDYQNPFSITRREMMQIAKIGSVATYHKCMKDLKTYRYIQYLPSFHPVKGSLVFLNHPLLVFASR